MSTSKRRGNREGSNPVQRKDGRWQVHVRYLDPQGLAKRITVYGKTAADAREKADEVRDRLKQNLPAKDRKETVATFAENWVKTTLAASDRKASTRSLYASLTRSHIIGATIGSVSLDRLKPSHVDAWKVELRARGLAESSLRTTYIVLRLVLDAAVRDEAIARNPAAAVARPKVTKVEAASLNPAQTLALLDAAKASRYKLLFELLVNTGMRRGEGLALRWSDIRTEKELIHVAGTLARVDGTLVRTPPKTERADRYLPLSPKCEQILKAVKVRQAADRLRAGSAWVTTDYVFTTELGEPCDPRNALRAIKAAAKKAGLSTDIGCHTLRHTAASMMLERGVPLTVVSRILGHYSVSITGDIYGHVSPDVSAEAMATLAGAFEA
ncbi:MAG TPA: tyrosine-type recombinase/integrase [Nocardioides sp.]|uniref:site-specific integrase n=1 Tax=uncultured Nocardioides sp. TaxID=198441 RepID=UPI002636E041|nr:site-specific integrase [uncultured Nocardioides sp.]HRD60446.1 tyrosine-type recombinase/integrase [Nocardioides sp.]HRI94081.1 tyrosine-type recombinase/integrase [Nocardioides sp.]HRK44112.1 tyrosine-type recombinase/integrase [Nocardioides sp.]